MTNATMAPSFCDTWELRLHWEAIVLERFYVNDMGSDAVFWRHEAELLENDKSSIFSRQGLCPNDPLDVVMTAADCHEMADSIECGMEKGEVL